MNGYYKIRDGYSLKRNDKGWFASDLHHLCEDWNKPFCGWPIGSEFDHATFICPYQMLEGL